jgi:uncharacterized protein YjbI with pentapeptide repeats
LLRSGVKAWHKWKPQHPEAIADLAGGDLSRANLHGANLIKADIIDAELSRANLLWTTCNKSIK